MKKPNIIFILSDQHNGQILGCSGDSYVRTPNIDKLAFEGVMFDTCYCNSPLCVPSRSSMLSGLLPSNNGIYNNMQALSPGNATFVHSLAASGYETVLCGRMHFVGYDQRHGYEKRFVGDLTPSFQGVDNEYEVYGHLMRTSNQHKISLEKSGSGDSAVLHYDRDVCDAACSYLESRKDDRPLFMTVGFYGPHCPYIAPRELYEYYYNILPVLEFDKNEYEQMHPAMKNWFKERNLENRYDPEETRRVRAAYYALVEIIDRHVGKIIQTVSETIGLENTLIIYTSDHGDNIGEHGLFWKTNFYEGAARVPLIFSWPEKLPKNTVIRGNSSLVDIAPTLIDIAGAIPLPEMDGESLVEYLKSGKDLPSDRAIISQLGDIKGDAPSAMIRKGKYKLIAHSGYEQVQLFDLENDPNEKNDLGLNAEYNSIITELKSELFQYWNPMEEAKKLSTAIAHFKILKEWAKAVKPAPIEEWRGDNFRDNYLDT